VSDLITHVNDDAFEQQVLKSETPVLLDFWAEWCGPCKAMSPMLDELAKQYEGKLRIVKVNIDHNQQTPPHLWRARYPDPDGVQERQGRSDPDRRRQQGPSDPDDRQGHLNYFA